MSAWIIVIGVIASLTFCTMLATVAGAYMSFQIIIVFVILILVYFVRWRRCGCCCCCRHLCWFLSLLHTLLLYWYWCAATKTCFQRRDRMKQKREEKTSKSIAKQAISIANIFFVSQTTFQWIFFFASQSNQVEIAQCDQVPFLNDDDDKRERGNETEKVFCLEKLAHDVPS